MSLLLGRTGVYRDRNHDEWAAIIVGEAYPGEALHGQLVTVFIFPRSQGDPLSPHNTGDGYLSCALNLRPMHMAGVDAFTPHDHAAIGQNTRVGDWG